MMDNLRQAALLTVSRRELFEKLKIKGIDSTRTGYKAERVLLEHIKDKFNLLNCSKSMSEELSRVVHIYMVGLSQRWKASHRNSNNFLNKHNNWLNSVISIKNMDLPSKSTSANTRKPGRPKKDFDLSGVKSKTRKVTTLVAGNSLSELTHATNIKLRQSGKRDAAIMLQEIVSTPKRATKVKKICKGSNTKSSKYTPEEALALITASKLTYRKYQMIRKSANEKGLKIYPSYEQIKKAKKLCYPQDEDCTINDMLAEIKLQSIVDLTIKRLCSLQEEVLCSILDDRDRLLQNLTILFKWGCDGSGGQSRYKQKANAEEFEDAYVLATSLVPLQIFCTKNGTDRVVLWQNPRPSSTSFCRPLRFRFVKETNDTILQEFDNVRNQIKGLQPTIIEVKEHILQVTQIFEETMVDGKVCNVLASNKSTQKCYICNATSKDMNNLELIRKRQSKTETFSWGLSTLHAHIRFMECILHIAYKLEIKKWQCRRPDEKEIVMARKKHIIETFRAETGLLLDTPKQGGGNTNDGNSARRFFKNAAVTAQITGVNEKLVHHFHVILRTLSCGYDINLDEFKKFCDATADLYISLYHWFPMPVTVHKILLHGPEVINHFLLPIGQMSEEAQEARHKEFRKYRIDHSRKISRTKTNTDILHNLLISSDPIITHLKPQERNKQAAIDSDVLKLIRPPITHITRLQRQETDDSDSDSTIVTSGNSDWSSSE